jgi:hypothetical protein
MRHEYEVVRHCAATLASRRFSAFMQLALWRLQLGLGAGPERVLAGDGTPAFCAAALLRGPSLQTDAAAAAPFFFRSAARSRPCGWARRRQSHLAKPRTRPYETLNSAD